RPPGRGAPAARRRGDPKPAEIAHDVSLRLGEVEQILRSAQTPVSLEKPVGNEGESEFGHFLADRAPLPEGVADDNSRSRAYRVPREPEPARATRARALLRT